jgi:hypothetical protein
MPEPFDPENLIDTLADPTMNKAFRAFLEKEHATENLDFYEAVDRYRAMAMDRNVNDEQLKAEAKRIYTKFIDNSGAQVDLRDGDLESLKNLNAEINLKTDNRNTVDARHEAITAGTISRDDLNTMFDGSQEEIYNMSNNDSYKQRFQKTEGFKSALKEVNERRAAELQASVKPELDRIDKLNKKLDGLKTSGWERFKTYFGGGGPEKAKQDTIAEIDRLKTEVFRKTDPEGFEQAQKQTKENIKGLKAENKKLAPDVFKHDEARLEHEYRKRDVQQNAEHMSDDDLITAVKKQVAASKIVKDTQPSVDQVERNKQEIDALKKEVNLRAKVGDQFKRQEPPSQNKLGPKQGMK